MVTLWEWLELLAWSLLIAVVAGVLYIAWVWVP